MNSEITLAPHAEEKMTLDVLGKFQEGEVFHYGSYMETIPLKPPTTVYWAAVKLQGMKWTMYYGSTPDIKELVAGGQRIRLKFAVRFYLPADEAVYDEYVIGAEAKKGPSVGQKHKMWVELCNMNQPKPVIENEEG